VGHCFPVRSSGPGGLIRLFDGVLPQSHDERKKQKPDLEALTLIPPYSDLCFGALLAIGSGSRSNRKRSVLLGLDACGTVCTAPRIVDLSFILDPLAAEFAQVNIEGAVVAGQELRLFQRGNKRHIDNAVIRYSPSAVLNGQFHDADCDRAARSRCHPTLGVAAFDPGRQRLSMKVVKLEPPDYTSSASL
ncbi:DUF6910 family protein, partial [Sinorhizobium medicae]|uniref:DUF6910 family protein n=1 Tax=Sinorhizobium medicae TaxID=110321 RepID=UPI003CC65903